MDTVQIIIAILAVAINLAIVVITFMKGKYVFGIIGIFIPLFALFGACRQAKPDSSWARSRYDDIQMARSIERYPGRIAAAV